MIFYRSYFREEAQKILVLAIEAEASIFIEQHAT